jgi:hypothetical protein
VKGKHFAWARPLRRADHEALGEAAPDGPILGVSVPELVSKGVLMAARPNVYFTTPHFDGYKAILVQLDAIDVDELGALLLEAWLARAPKRLARAYLDEARERGDVG